MEIACKRTMKKLNNKIAKIIILTKAYHKAGQIARVKQKKIK